MTEDELLESLRRLSPKKFVEIVLRSAAGKKPLGEAEPARFVVAVASEDHDLYLVCEPDEHWRDDSPLCQSGEHEGLLTISWAKNSSCPICGAHVYGT